MTSLWDIPEAIPTDPLPMDRRADVLVIGAGFTGLATGLLLARAGKRTLVVEAGRAGIGTSGRTTGKVSLLQGTKLSRLLRLQPERVVAGYVDANREGRDWLLRFCEDHDVPVQRRTAATWAASPGETAKVAAEHEAAQRLGLPTRLVAELDAPFPTHGAVLLPDQAQLDPIDLVHALMTQLRAHDGVLHEGNRVVRVGLDGHSATLDNGEELHAEAIVVATGTPIVDRALHFARLSPDRSYLISFERPEVPELMAISAGSDVRSVRDAPDPVSGEARLLVGGAGHVVGRGGPTGRHLDTLREWTARYFPGAVETHAWSAQDYASYDGMPYVGKVPGTGLYVATGYDKWGLTNSVAAAHTLAAELLGSRAPEVSRHAVRPRSTLKLLALNAGVARELVTGHVAALAKDQRPAPLCSHLGGPLCWNEVEQSWDCPLHGSRFDAIGNVLEGPATKPVRLPD